MSYRHISTAFRLFAKLAFSEDLNRGEAADKRVQEPGKQIPVAGVFRIKGILRNGHVSTRFAQRLGVSAVKLFIDLSKSARNKRAKRPASDEISADRWSDKYQLTRYTRNTRYASFSGNGLIYEGKRYENRADTRNCFRPITHKKRARMNRARFKLMFQVGRRGRPTLKAMITASRSTCRSET